MASMPAEMIEVHDALREYVRIHDSIFRFSLRKLLPVFGLFKPIDFGRHKSDLAGISENLASIHGTLCQRSEMPDVFSEYVATLRDTVEALREICRRLDGEAQCGIGHYRFRAYRQDVARYEEFIERYQRLGVKINRCG